MGRWTKVTVEDTDGPIGTVLREVDTGRFVDERIYLAECSHCHGSISAAKLSDALAYLGEPGHHGCSRFDVAVEIPGTFSVTYNRETGVREMTFSPLASYAGYFGPAATCHDESLDVQSTDGPFWQAVQDELSGDYVIKWTE